MLTNDDALALPLARRRRGRSGAAPEGSAARGRAEPAPARVPGLLGRVHLAARSRSARGVAPAAAQDRREARRRRGVPRDRRRSRAPVPGRARRGRRRAPAGRPRHGARPLRASAQDERRATRAGRGARRPRPAGAPPGRPEPGRRLDRRGATTGALDRVRVPGARSGRSARPTPRRESWSRRSASSSAERRRRPRRATRSSRRAARSGSPTRTSTAATSGGPRSCSAEPSRGHRQTVDPAQRARIYWSQSRLHTLKGNQDAAARYARKTLELLELGEDVYNTARAHQLLAFIAVERGRGEEALDEVERGLALLGERRRPRRDREVPDRGGPRARARSAATRRLRRRR